MYDIFYYLEQMITYSKIILGVMLGLITLTLFYCIVINSKAKVLEAKVDIMAKEIKTLKEKTQ